MLDEYRRSFGEACEAVVRTIRELGQAPTARLAKSTLSIVEKLRRESIRLSQMQDIAGCRVVVADIVQQDRFIASLKNAFPAASVIDRREDTSYGYRAVHVIADISGEPVEIQVRSSLQHLWAELSEKSSDVLDPTIKYGGGSHEWRTFLIQSSKAVAAYERLEKLHFDAVAFADVARAAHEKFKKAVAELLEYHPPDHEVQELQEKLEDSTHNAEHLEKRVEESKAELVRLRKVNIDLLSGALSRLDNLKRQNQ